MATSKKSGSKPAAEKTPKPAKAAPAVSAKKKPATTKPAAAKPKSPVKKPSKKSAGGVVSPQQRAHYVEVAAFYIAERRNFAPGNPMEDWIAAEAEIDRLLAEGRLG